MNDPHVFFAAERTLPADDLPPGCRIGLAPVTASVVPALGAALAVYLAFA